MKISYKVQLKAKNNKDFYFSFRKLTDCITWCGVVTERNKRHNGPWLSVNIMECEEDSAHRILCFGVSADNNLKPDPNHPDDIDGLINNTLEDYWPSYGGYFVPDGFGSPIKKYKDAVASAMVK